MLREQPPDDFVLSEAQVREVIELATKAPTRAEGVSIGELRQIAQELEIDRDAFADALAMVLLKPHRSHTRRPWLRKVADRLGSWVDGVLPRRGRLIVMGFVGGLFGWIDAYAGSLLREVLPNGMIVMRGSTSYLIVRLSILLMLLTLANSLSRRIDGRRSRYLTETLAAWGSFLAAWSFTTGYVTGDGLRFVTICMAIFGFWGWLIIRPNPRPGSFAKASQPTPMPRTVSGNRDSGASEYVALNGLVMPSLPQPAALLQLRLLRSVLAGGTT